MSTSTGDAVAERQRSRAARNSNQSAGRSSDPPRQRRPALAALAVLLIVGGALLAGLLAIRMDSREPVLAAAHDIAPGTLITADDLVEVQVAADDLELISADFADQVLDGATYAKLPIKARSLVDQNMLTKEDPVGEGRAIVAVTLNPALTPSGELSGGDLVQVIRVAGGQGAGGGSAKPITEALVLSVTSTASEELGATSAASASLLVPEEAAPAVVDASGADAAGLALLERGQSLETELKVYS